MLWAVLASLAPVAASAGSLTVRFHDVVEPDAALRAFIGHIRQLDPKAVVLNAKAVNALFATRVKAFQRSLDPFQPWNRTADVTSDYLKGAADLMVEQGEIEEGKAASDYRPDALRQIIGLVDGGKPFGRLKEMPGAICAPAEYEVDRKAALAFARKFELDAYSLRFYDKPVALLARPGSAAVGGRLPAWTLMMFDYLPRTPDGWGFYETSDGRKGYMKDRDDTLGLAQHHVCFARMKGKYEIVALFGYGL